MGRARSPPSPGRRINEKTLDIISLDGNKTPNLEHEDELDEDDPEAKERKALINARLEFKAREAALKLNYSERQDFDLAESKITSLMHP
jgi:hypothetical protein